MSSRELRYLLITNLHEEAKLTALQICLVFERNLQTKYVAESRVEIYTESLKPENSFSETSTTRKRSPPKSCRTVPAWQVLYRNNSSSKNS